MLLLLDLGLEGVTEVETDPKGKFVSFKVTPSNDRVLCVYALGIAPGNSCLEGVSLKDYTIIWKKNEGNENKIILGNFNCVMDKMERDGRNATLYKCHFNYALSKLIVHNGLEDL